MLNPGVIEVLPVETHFEPKPLDNRLCMLLATGEFYYASSSRVLGTFTLERPNDEADRRAGRYCTATGYWTAGHDVVYVGGLPYSRKYAPRNAHEEIDGINS